MELVFFFFFYLLLLLLLLFYSFFRVLCFDFFCRLQIFACKSGYETPSFKTWLCFIFTLLWSAVYLVLRACALISSLMHRIYRQFSLMFILYWVVAVCLSGSFGITLIEVKYTFVVGRKQKKDIFPFSV